MKLKDYPPWKVYHDEENVAELQEAIEKELLLLLQARDDLYLQLRPSTSTWGMSGYEQEYGIHPNSEKLTDYRLAGWRARRRGRGTTTEEVIKSVAESYSQGPVDVIVYPQQYLMDIKVPHISEHDYIDDFIAAIEEIKPAHLGFGTRYTDTWAEILGLHRWEKYKGQTWGDILDLSRWVEYSTLTWGDLSSKTWAQVLGTGTWGPLLGDNTWGDVKEENADWDSVYHFEGVKEA